MHKTEPKVYLLGETQIDENGVRGYMAELGVPDWKTCDVSSAEKIIEICGRACYKAFGADLNANITKVREGNDNYIWNLLKSGHGSVLECCSVTFMFHDVSRVFSHEAVRHRAGTAFSQESLRYVRLTDLGFWLPQETLKEIAEAVGQDATDEGIKIMYDAVVYLEKCQLRLADLFQLDKGKDFPYKKKATSMMRRIAPIGLSTSIAMTMNHRALRHILHMRTSPHAEEEIRFAFAKVGKICKEKWPNLYADFEIEMVDNIPFYKSEFVKI